MSDEAAFAAAVAASPDDDLPRLVFADWLDDQGEAERAEFVRAQVQCAATPAWEPFAVYCRHRRPEWTTGDPWRMSLPWVQGWAVEWHPDRAFRRGFGHSLLIRDMTAFLADAPRLFDAAPIDELHLPTATLDQWRSFGRAKWLPRVKSVHFYGTTTPIEPVRVLCESPLATGIEEIVFEGCSRPGMPVLLEGLFESELGRRLKKLGLKNGALGSDPEDFLEALRNLPDLQLLEMSLENIVTRMEWAFRLADAPIVRGSRSIKVRDGTYGTQFVQVLADWSEVLPLQELRVNRSEVYRDAVTTILSYADEELLRLLDVSELANGEGEEVIDVGGFRRLSSFSLAKSNVGNPTVQTLAMSQFWPTLTELDLRDNRITNAGAKHLLATPVPPDLTALLLGGNPISDDMRAKLRRHFGPAVLFDE